MEEKNLEALRHYYRRMIADKNKEINSLSFNFPETIKRNMKYKLYETFAKGKGSIYDRNISILNFEQAYNYTNNKRTKEPAYKYFDLDTLIAYDMYLMNIISYLYKSRKRQCRNFSIIKDFDSAMNNSALYSINNAGLINSGFYNLKCPVTIMRDQNKMPVYERTLTQKDFDKRYVDIDFDQLLMQYLDEKYHIYGEKKEEVQEVLDDSEGYEYIDHNGKQYCVLSKQIYLDSNMSPIKYIKATSVNGENELNEFFDFSMQIYSGDVYDTEGNFVCSTQDNQVDFCDEGME